MNRRRLLRFALLGLVLAATPIAAGQDRPDPIVVLVSFDGWRWDYFDRVNAPNLRALAAKGVRAGGLIPAFPSTTFPNHYTLVTGLYPEHHGIISNSMKEPGFPDRFSMSAATARDARWWGGEPIWVTAIRQGRRASAMFWPGSEAPIRGVRPTHWLPFDDGKPNEARVKQVLDWLALPAGQRPSFITLYFSDVDSAGHDAGPESQAAFDAAARLDEALGQLQAGIAALGLSDRVNLVIVSDHGMTPLDPSRVIVIDDYLDLSTVDVVEWSPVLQVWPRRGSFDDVFRALDGRHPALKVYRREAVPPHLHYRGNPRIPDVIAIADEGWLVTDRLRLMALRLAGFRKGGHGFDPSVRSMHGLFVAAGPRIRQGLVVAPFENVHVYEFLCRLLGLSPATNDGDPAVTREFTR